MPSTRLCLAAVVARPRDSSMSITHDAKLSPSTWAVDRAAGDGSLLSTPTIETLLHASVEIAKQRQLIATLIQENELLRQRLGGRTDFDFSADSTPALCRKQAG
jgi:hypothetical protein